MKFEIGDRVKILVGMLKGKLAEVIRIDGTGAILETATGRTRIPLAHLEAV